MTAQITDGFYYNNEEWTLIATSKKFGFDPKKHGLEPVSPSTACWDGYYCDYSIDDSLKLKNLFICLGWPGFPFQYDETKEGPEYPELLGKQVSIVEDDGYYHNFDHYYALDYPMNFSGKILLGKNFMSGYYIHMGYQQAWAYENVKEFVFKNGKLVEINDYSDKVQKLREDINKDPDFFDKMHNNIPEFVNNSFSKDYEIKAWWIDKY